MTEIFYVCHVTPVSLASLIWKGLLCWMFAMREILPLQDSLSQCFNCFTMQIFFLYPDRNSLDETVHHSKDIHWLCSCISHIERLWIHPPGAFHSLEQANQISSCHILQSSHHLHDSSLGPLQFFNASLKVGQTVLCVT